MSGNVRFISLSRSKYDSLSNVDSDALYFVEESDGTISHYKGTKEVKPKVKWSELLNVPSSFTPSSHTHSWSSITGKPTSFSPSSHTHSASDITSGTFSTYRIPNLSASKITSGVFSPDRLGTGSTYSYYTLHGDGQWKRVSYSNISGTPSTMSKSEIISGTSSYAQLVRPSDLHDAIKELGSSGTVSWSDITGKPSTFTPSSHSHSWSSITGKPSTFTPSSHSHDWNDIKSVPYLTSSEILAGSNRTNKTTSAYELKRGVNSLIDLRLGDLTGATDVVEVKLLDEYSLRKGSTVTLSDAGASASSSLFVVYIRMYEPASGNSQLTQTFVQRDSETFEKRISRAPEYFFTTAGGNIGYYVLEADHDNGAGALRIRLVEGQELNEVQVTVYAYYF